MQIPTSHYITTVKTKSFCGCVILHPNFYFLFKKNLTCFKMIKKLDVSTKNILSLPELILTFINIHL